MRGRGLIGIEIFDRRAAAFLLERNSNGVPPSPIPSPGGRLGVSGYRCHRGGSVLPPIWLWVLNIGTDRNR